MRRLRILVATTTAAAMLAAPATAFPRSSWSGRVHSHAAHHAHHARHAR